MSNNEKLVTPVCTAKYLWLFEPNTRFKPDGEYSITCIMDQSQPWTNLVRMLELRLKAFYEASCVTARKKLKLCEHLPWKVVKDESGNVVERVFVVKNNAVGRSKDGTIFHTKPRIVGPDPQIILAEKDLDGKLGNGTKVRVGFAVNLWHNDAQGVGLSARLSMVQIIEPKYYDAGEGFVDPEGGEAFTKIPSDWFKPKAKSHQEDTSGQEVDRLIDKEEFLDGLR